MRGRPPSEAHPALAVEAGESYYVRDPVSKANTYAASGQLPQRQLVVLVVLVALVLVALLLVGIYFDVIILILD